MHYSHLFALLSLLGLYFLPYIVAGLKNRRNRGAILLTNFALGWTGFGWLFAMIWAMTYNPATR